MGFTIPTSIAQVKLVVDECIGLISRTDDWTLSELLTFHANDEICILQRRMRIEYFTGF